jgi:hypothetical protein
MFKLFSQAVAANFARMSAGELFTVDTLDIYGSYLAAFPEGSNPIFRERTEHDCNCCKQFIRTLGRVVTINADGTRSTVWDNCGELPEPYATVANALRNLVVQSPIQGVFRSKEPKYGTDHNFDHATGQRWDHFEGRVARIHSSPNPAKLIGDVRSARGVLERGVTDFKPEFFTLVIELIEANGLYRGSEHLNAIKGFRDLKVAYDAARAPQDWLWAFAGKPLAKFRNTAIGGLFVDLAEGFDFDAAVRRFEATVAPQNYKRPTAAITPTQINAAVAALNELGLEGAVERRMARFSDLSVSDVLFVDNRVAGQMKGGLTNLLLDAVKPKPVKIDNPIQISVSDFMALPKTSVALVLSAEQQGNFVTLTAPVHANTGKLFKWNNDFAWSYDGEVADSIKQRVKRAGGNVDGKLRVSLSWHNSDDLDLHAQAPEGHIHYHRYHRHGVLDVDMNGLDKHDSMAPVENMTWKAPRDGAYRIWVNQFSPRECNRSKPGFEIEFHFDGVSQFFGYAAPHTRGDIDVATFRIVKGQMADLVVNTTLTRLSGDIEKWGVKTGAPVEVETILLSPNHWENSGCLGNKHWFFILKDCKNPDAVRGIYNEFLRGELDQHRKVFEVLASKTKAPSVPDQLSGVGFSTGTVIAIVDGHKAYNIQF